MDVQQITQEQTGVWQIITVTNQHILLFLPPDGRASITVLTTFRDLVEAASGTIGLPSSELVTWGSYGVEAGMGAGITVGQSAVLADPGTASTSLAQEHVASVAERPPWRGAGARGRRPTRARRAGRGAGPWRTRMRR